VTQADLLNWAPKPPADRAASKAAGESFPAHQAHSDTSRAAAAEIRPNAGTLRAKVLDCLRSSSGLTDEEIQNWLQMPASTQRPRRVELVRMGLVADSGRRRETMSGRFAVVWVAK
jgi:hypothetical protein